MPVVTSGVIPWRARRDTAAGCRRTPGTAPDARTSGTSRWARREVAGFQRRRDRAPQRADRVGEVEQLVLGRCVLQRQAVRQVDQLELGGHHAAQPVDHQRVELELVERAALEVGPGGAACLVVDDAHLPGGCLVEPIDEPAQRYPVRGVDLHRVLAGLGVEPARILEPEVAAHQHLGRTQPTRDVLRRQHRGQLGTLLRHPVPGRPHGFRGPARRPFRRGPAEHLLQHGVHQRAAHRGRTRRLGQPVHGPEPVEQRAGLEVARPRRRQGQAPPRPGCRDRLVCRINRRMVGARADRFGHRQRHDAHGRTPVRQS